MSVNTTAIAGQFAFQATFFTGGIFHDPSRPPETMKTPGSGDYAKTSSEQNKKQVQVSGSSLKRPSTRRFCIARANEHLTNASLASTNDHAVLSMLCLYGTFA
jgi:hypothetical protein